MTVTDNGIEKASSEDVGEDTTADVVSDDAQAEVKPADNEVAAKAKAEKMAEDAPGRVSVSVRTLTFAVVTCVLVGAIGVLAWLYIGARSKLNAQDREADNDRHAEEVAIDYAVNAAEMDYRDLNAWKVRLVNGTSPELKEKLTKAANDMEQLLAPLQWNSTARPLAAKVRSDTGGAYVVDAFVSVLTKTMQSPQGLQSTATYSVTIDSNKDWQISDVGGIDSALGSK